MDDKISDKQEDFEKIAAIKIGVALIVGVVIGFMVV